MNDLICGICGEPIKYESSPGGGYFVNFVGEEGLALRLQLPFWKDSPKNDGLHVTFDRNWGVTPVCHMTPCFIHAVGSQIDELRILKESAYTLALSKVVNSVRIEFLKELKGDVFILPDSIRNAYLEYKMAEQQGFKG